MSSIQMITPELEDRIQALWKSNKLALNIPIIDLQHLWLLFMIAQSEEIVRLNKTVPEFNDVKEIFVELSEYIVEHFDIEEKLFQIFGYPDAQKHKDHHDTFISEFQKIYEQCSKGKADAVMKLVPYLHTWLLNHIVKEDRLYQSYFANRGPNVEAAIQKIISEKHVTIKPMQADLYKRVMKGVGGFESTHKDIIEKIYGIVSKFKLSIHVPIVDIQHMWILKLMLELDVASHTFSTNQKRFFFERTVKLLNEYTKEHFFTEELLMREFQYPDFARHCDEHKKFLELIVLRNAQHSAGDVMAASELIKDLKEWIFSHIALEDRQLGAFLGQKHRQVTDFVKSQIHLKTLILRRSQVDLYQQVNGIIVNRGKKD